MKFVLDASVAIKWILPESDSDLAIQVRNGFQANTLELVAPDTFAVEVAHALTRAERKGILPQADTYMRMADVFAAALTLIPFLSLLPARWKSRRRRELEFTIVSTWRWQCVSSVN